MVVNEIFQWHKGIIKNLRPTSTGYHATLYRDVPMAVFRHIVHVMTSNMYKTDLRETRAVLCITIESLDKVVMVFNRMNSPSVIVPRSKLLERSFGPRGYCKVVCSTKRPFIAKYLKGSPRLVLSFSYGHWNDSDMPQHTF